jgi:hypothetical protein
MVLPSGENMAGWRLAEHAVDVVGDRPVLQGKRMGVVPQRRGRIAVAQSMLGREEFAPAHEECGHRLAQAMECDAW